MPFVSLPSRPWVALLGALLLLIACAVPEDESSRAEDVPSVRTADDRDQVTDDPRGANVEIQRGALVITHPSELTGLDLSTVEHLDLSLSVEDTATRASVGRADVRDNDACAGLDLVRLAEATPRLRSLRIAGCQPAVHAGLSAFGARLERLELADVVLDGVTIGRLRALTGLRALILTRVRPGPDPLDGLSSLPLRSITLRDLEKDSILGDLLGDFPQLEHARLEGRWAGYRAMLSLSHASRLRHLELVETSVGNYALNQVKPLSNLRIVDWTGDTFNDSSPLYLRELPVTRFRCACAGFGDNGLKHLRYLQVLKVIDLPQSSVTGAGMVHLAELEHLRELHVTYRDIGDEGIAHLAELPGLEHLTLGNVELERPGLTRLGALTGLRELVLAFPNLDDRAAAGLSGLVHLQVLDLGGTSLSDEGLAALAGLTELRVLKLNHTRVTNRGLAHLASLDKLEVLELDHTDLVDDGVAHLSGLTGLRDLRLDHTLITDEAITHLQPLRGLERLNLAGTVITDAGAEKLAELPHLRAVNLDDTRVVRQ